MQPQNDEWQQPDQPKTVEPHAYVEEAQPMQPVETDDSFPTAPVEMREGDETVVRWQASEYIQHDKNTGWYIGLGVVTVLLVLFAIFVIDSWTFAVLIPVMAAALLVYALHPPAVLSYTLSRKGLHVNDRLHSFTEFREFGVVKDDSENSVYLIPRKRFQPGVTVYFPVEVGEAIVDMLAARLPMRDVKLDPIDRLIRFLRI